MVSMFGKSVVSRDDVLPVEHSTHTLYVACVGILLHNTCTCTWTALGVLCWLFV